MTDKDLTVEVVDAWESESLPGIVDAEVRGQIVGLAKLARRAVTEIPKLEAERDQARKTISDNGKTYSQTTNRFMERINGLETRLASSTAQVEQIEEMQIRIGKDADHIVILEAQMERMRDALVRIRGWREIDRNTLRERLTAIEEICDEALSDLPSTNLEKSDA